MTSILMDHDDEHAPVRHEFTTIVCNFCNRPHYPGAVQTLVDDRGRKQHRCYSCRDAANKRYIEAIGSVDPLMARYLDGDR